MLDHDFPNRLLQQAGPLFFLVAEFAIEDGVRVGLHAISLGSMALPGGAENLSEN